LLAKAEILTKLCQRAEFVWKRGVLMKRLSETEHDKMIEGVINYLVMKGYRNVNADLSGYVQPIRILTLQISGSCLQHMRISTGLNSGL